MTDTTDTSDGFYIVRAYTFSRTEGHRNKVIYKGNSFFSAQDAVSRAEKEGVNSVVLTNISNITSYFISASYVKGGIAIYQACHTRKKKYSFLKRDGTAFDYECQSSTITLLRSETKSLVDFLTK